jgi:EAL domain-containing protein (putative c-di-GMP-specific phosphodiesterase class I)
LLPQFLKLDLSLTRDIESDPVKQALTAAFFGFAAQIGSHLLAEGVETAAELGTLIALGVEHAQGDNLGAPAPLPFLASPKCPGTSSALSAKWGTLAN